MTPLTELAAANLAIVAGKGGVGKTTVTAVLARAAASSGRRVLVIELDGKHVLDSQLPDIGVRHISAAESLEEYLVDHGFKRIAKRLVTTGVIDVVGTAAPGIDDLVVLGKIKQLERSGNWDLIVVDGPAAGHAITFLTAASGLLDAVRSGPVREQAEDVLAMLRDPRRCQVILVTLPETTPVNELIETSFAIEEEVGVQLGPIVVNQVDRARLPDPAEWTLPTDDLAKVAMAPAIEAARFRRTRVELQRSELDRLAREVPLPQVHLPILPVAGLGPDEVAQMVGELTAEATS